MDFCSPTMADHVPSALLHNGLTANILKLGFLNAGFSSTVCVFLLSGDKTQRWKSRSGFHRNTTWGWHSGAARGISSRAARGSSAFSTTTTGTGPSCLSG